MPLFSIIIPVYNIEPYLKACLDSVLAQTEGDWEAVCIDDGSTDGSPALLRRYAGADPRIRIVSQPNAGLSAARNAGLDAARGDYLLFLDGDDRLRPDTLALLKPHLGQDDLVCFGGVRIAADGSPLPTDTLVEETGLPGPEYYRRHALEPREFPFVCVVLRCYRRAYLAACGLRFLEGIYHEDNLFTPLACHQAQRVSVVPEHLYLYQLRAGSITASRTLRHRTDLLTVANHLAAYFRLRPETDRSVVYRAIAQHYQAAFLGATPQEVRHLRRHTDWQLYRTVSRTRPRHRLNYLLLRLAPPLFNAINTPPPYRHTANQGPHDAKKQ